MKNLLHTPDVVWKIDSTLDIYESFEIISKFKDIFSTFFLYTSQEYGLNEILSLTKLFSTFHSRAKVNLGINRIINSTIPIDILRYKMLSDGSPYHLSQDPFSHKNGYIVEGCFWSNGFYHLTRQEYSIEPLSIHLYIDQNTKDLGKYP